MKWFTPILVLSAISCAAFADVLPAPDAVLGQMRLANTYFMRQWPDPGKAIVTNRSRQGKLVDLS